MWFFPYGVLNSGATRCRKSFSIPFLFLVAIAPAIADVNSWTKPTSGYWEEQSSWSLGVLPNSSQSVYITNPGWKAVAIGANTAQNFPASMQIPGAANRIPAGFLQRVVNEFLRVPGASANHLA
jgi:hypothetical protein